MRVFGQSKFDAGVARRAVRPIAEILEGRQLLATIVVNTTGDADGPDGSSTLSLRQAIEISNGTLAITSLSTAQTALVTGALSTPNTIDFDILGTGPFTISPDLSLPAITSSVVIDGDSQPGAQPNTNGPGQGKNTVLEIELDGAGAGTNSTGLDFETSNNTVTGLAVGGFGVAIKLGSLAGTGVADSSDNLVTGNFIGTDITGTESLPNGEGISIPYYPSTVGINDTIGGTGASAGNLISGNGTGLLDGEGCLVEGNFIGTDISGTKSIPNNEGIDAANDLFPGAGVNYAGDDVIGGTVAGAGNVLSGNKGFAISLEGSGTTVQGNRIGVDVSGGNPLPNGGDGLDVSGNNNTIGGEAAGEANIIAYNQGVGVNEKVGQGLLGVPEGFGIQVSGNSIFDNGNSGILTEEFAPYLIPTPQPVLTSAIANSSGSLVSATLDAKASTSYTIEFFANPTADPSGYGQGKTYLGSVAIMTDTSGHASFSFDSGSDLLGQAISATATESQGSTSEFAKDIAVPFSMTTTTLAGPSSLTPGQPATFTATVTLAVGGTPTGLVNFLDGGTVLGQVALDASGQATFATSQLGVGTHNVVANYLGDSSQGASQSSPLTLSVQPLSTTTVLSGPSQIVSGQPATFTSTVTSQGAPPTGLVDFLDDGVVLDQVALGASGQATFVANGLNPGQHEITASYAGDATHSGSLSSPTDLLVSLVTTMTTLEGPAGSSTLGQPTTFAAVVGATSGSVPTGQVNFLQDGVVIGSAPLDASGVAVFITKSLSPGTHAITAAYVGDPTDAVSLSNSIAVGVFAPHAFGGPAVTSVAAVAPDSLTVVFNRGLTPGPAQNVTNYSIVGPNHKSISVESAVYNLSNASVTLTTLEDLVPGQSYELTINGQTGDRIVDVFGIPLSGKKSGKPGHNYEGKIVVKKAAHPKGPKPKAHATASRKDH